MAPRAAPPSITLPPQPRTPSPADGPGEPAARGASRPAFKFPFAHASSQSLSSAPYTPRTPYTPGSGLHSPLYSPALSSSTRSDAPLLSPSARRSGSGSFSSWLFRSESQHSRQSSSLSGLLPPFLPGLLTPTSDSPYESGYESGSSAYDPKQREEPRRKQRPRQSQPKRRWAIARLTPRMLALVIAFLCLALVGALQLAPAQHRDKLRLNAQDLKGSISTAWSAVKGGEAFAESYKKLLGAHGLSTGTAAAPPVIMHTLPITSTTQYDDGARYLGFLPHSGLHNQRSGLENAFLLAHLLNRTLLVPPIWLGWPVPFRPYERLQEQWSHLTETHLSEFNLSASADTDETHPSFVTTKDTYPLSDDTAYWPSLAEQLARGRRRFGPDAELTFDGFFVNRSINPHECKSYSYDCRWTYEDHVVSWHWFAGRENDFPGSRSRWDMREETLLELAGGDPAQVFVLEDQQRSDFKFVFDDSETELVRPKSDPDDNFGREVSIERLREVSHKVVLTGSMFGWMRIVGGQSHNSDDPFEAELHALRQNLQHRLVLREPLVLRAADAISNALGGGAYIGVHARVGDGGFLVNAHHNMADLWHRVASSIGVEDDVAALMWERVKPDDDAEDAPAKVLRRYIHHHRSSTPHRAALVLEGDASSSWTALDSGEDDGGLEVAPLHEKRQSVELAQGVSDESGLACRGALHSDPRFAAFNAPLYIATDSRHPEEDTSLAPFFAAFPCSFILGDFEGARARGLSKKARPALDAIKSATSETGAAPLGRMLIPLLEAAIAAKGAHTVGTKGSTFSGYTESVLHAAYHS